MKDNEAKVYVPSPQKRREQQIEQEQLNAEIRKKAQDMLLTTTHMLDGYKIVRYIDIIAEDVVFKAALSDQINNLLDNFVDLLSFSEKKLSGNYSLMFKAKEYVKNKLIYDAVQLGANAIIGIDYETNVGNGTYATVSMNGTAVVVEKIA